MAKKYVRIFLTSFFLTFAVLAVYAQSSTQPVLYANAVTYDPVHYTCVVGTPIQLRNGYSVYDIDGGSLLSCEIILPVSASDGQFVRISASTGLVVTTLTVRSSPGVTADNGVVVSFGSSATASWQMQTGNYRRLGS